MPFPAVVPGTAPLDGFRMSPDSHYVLHGAVELYMMRFDVGCAASLMQLNADWLVDTNNFDHAALESLYEQWREQWAQPYEVAAVDLRCALSIPWEVQRLKEHCVSEITSHLASREGIKHPMTNMDEFSRRHDSLIDPHDLRGTVHRICEQSAHRANDTINKSFERFEASATMYSPMEVLTYEAQLRNNPARILIEGPDRGVIALAQRTSQEHKQIRKAKKAIKKAIKLCASLYGEKTINGFLGGDTLQVEGKYFNYKITKSIDVVAHTKGCDKMFHVPYKLELYSKDSPSLFLADICVYYKSTPVIDQLIGLLTTIRQGFETDILEKGNLFNRSPHFYDNAAVNELRLTSPRRSTQVQRNPQADAFFNRMADYQKETTIIRHEVQDEVNDYVRGLIYIPDEFFEKLSATPLSHDELVDQAVAGVLSESSPVAQLLS
ncbi:hypothetical protein [Neptuniibacter sp. QD37_11]|uniref:hypothetical protein n=1 Tax=Neptuniibacter sp. QD37_11 TaxID=3398209 RepID=UPI0039F5C25A